MEFLILILFILLPLALVVGGIALFVNAIQSIKNDLDRDKFLRGK